MEAYRSPYNRLSYFKLVSEGTHDVRDLQRPSWRTPSAWSRPFREPSRRRPCRRDAAGSVFPIGPTGRRYFGTCGEKD